MQIYMHISKSIGINFCRRLRQAQNGQLVLKHFIIMMKLSTGKLTKTGRHHLQLYSSAFLSVLPHFLS